MQRVNLKPNNFVTLNSARYTKLNLIRFIIAIQLNFPTKMGMKIVIVFVIKRRSSDEQEETNSKDLITIARLNQE